jgi:uncharacterized protein YndB with AHSA1/START domain
MTTLSHMPIAKAEMLIRKPVAEVFEAFIDPAITTKFWFTKGSSKMEAGSRVQWENLRHHYQHGLRGRRGRKGEASHRFDGRVHDRSMRIEGLAGAWS